MTDKKNKGASKKKTKPVLVTAPGQEEDQETKNVTRSIGIGMPVDEETFRELKEKARKL